jgi:hypothetical protein
MQLPPHKSNNITYGMAAWPEIEMKGRFIWLTYLVFRSLLLLFTRGSLTFGAFGIPL